MKIQTILVTTVLVSGLFSASVLRAGEALTADELRKLIVGNTALGVNANGKQMMNYFGPDGVLVRSVGGRLLEGRYHINPDGRQCISLQGTENCATILRLGDSRYQRVAADGAVLLTWEKIVSGKAIP